MVEDAAVRHARERLVVGSPVPHGSHSGRKTSGMDGALLATAAQYRTMPAAYAVWSISECEVSTSPPPRPLLRRRHSRPSLRSCAALAAG